MMLLTATARPFRASFSSSYLLLRNTRNFVASTSTAAVAATTATTATTANAAVRVAVFGSGRMGEIRASIVRSNPQYELVGIVDDNNLLKSSKSHDLAHRLGLGRASVYANMHELLLGQSSSWPSASASSKLPLDAIIVSTPTHTHASIIREACDAGLKGVFCEKPIGSNATEIKELFDLADTATLQLCCGFQRRFDPSYQALAESVRNGDIGTPIVSNIFFADHPAPPKEFMLDNGGDGGDIFLDLCAHDVDFITYALNDTVRSVYATITGPNSDPDFEKAGIQENAVMLLHMEQGTVVNLFMSRSATYGYDQRVEIFGTEGLVSVENPSENSMVLSNRSGIRHGRLAHSFPQRFEQAFANELHVFADVVLNEMEKQEDIGSKINDCKWPIAAEQCIRVQKVADAARRSCQEGRLVEIDYYN